MFILHHHLSLNWNMLPQLTNNMNFPKPDSSLIVPVFQKGDDPIDAINHMMSLLTAVVTSRYPTTNNQLRKFKASGSNSWKQRFVTCYNCKGEGHMSKQCTKPRRKRDYLWFKNKVLLVQAQASGQILYEEELTFLADPGIPEEHLKENESLMQMVTLLKNNFKKEESRNIDREIALEKRIKQLDNIIFKRDQSAQTVHMLTKPQFFYDHTTKQALAFKNNLRKLKGKALVDNDVIKHPSDPEMLKIDVEPITPKLLNKQTVYSAYIKHTQEEATVLSITPRQGGNARHKQEWISSQHMVSI
ncbi:reverse transcriptase domain-containing protein [Tanacetum coccineum]